jgi:hypothetical protein
MMMCTTTFACPRPALNVSLLLHSHIHGLFLYRLITSIGAPPAVNKQKLGLKIFFPKTFVFLRELFFYNAASCALVCVYKFADIRFVSALKSICTCRVDSAAKGDFVAWTYIYSKISLSCLRHRMTLHRYFTTSTR